MSVQLRHGIGFSLRKHCWILVALGISLVAAVAEHDWPTAIFSAILTLYIVATGVEQWADREIAKILGELTS